MPANSVIFSVVIEEEGGKEMLYIPPEKIVEDIVRSSMKFNMHIAHPY